MYYKHTWHHITHFQGLTDNIYGFGRPFLLLQFFTRPPPIHPYFYPSVFVFTRPNDGWTGLYIKLWHGVNCTASAFLQTDRSNHQDLFEWLVARNEHGSLVNLLLIMLWLCSKFSCRVAHICYWLGGAVGIFTGLLTHLYLKSIGFVNKLPLEEVVYGSRCTVIEMERL